jgi:nucleoside-diphosphate-sugar epimerase
MAPPTTLIYGGSGKVALALTRILTSSSPPHRVLNITRSTSHNPAIQAAGGEPLIASIEEASAHTMALVIREHGVTNVVWSAGAGGKGGPERTDRVDREGAIHSFEAAAEAGVKRFVMVSAVDVRDRSKGTPEWYSEESKKRSEGSWGAIGTYYKAKLAADIELVTGNQKRGLKYTIVRPSALKDDKGTGKIEAGKVEISSPISREDVAAVLAEVLEDDSTAGLAFDIVGGNTPIAEAVKNVAEKRIDTFEGHY